MAVTDKIRSLLRGDLQRNVAIMLASQMVSWALSIAVTFYLPGFLGERRLGSLTLAIAFAGTLASFVSLGTATVLVQDIAKHPHAARSLVRTSLRLRVGVGLALLILGLVSTPLLGYSSEIGLLIALILVAQIFAQIADAFQNGLVALEAMVQQSTAVIAEKITFSVLTITLAFMKAPLWWFGAVYLFSTTASAIVSSVSFMRVSRARMQETPHEPLRDVRSLAKAGVPFLTTRVFAAIYGNGSTAILMVKLSTLEAIGWFGVAQRFQGAAHMIPVAIVTAILPRLTRLKHEGDAVAFARLAWRMIALVFAAALPLSLILILFPERLLALLHYPPGFAGTVPVLRLEGCVIFLWFLQQGCGTALVAAGKQKVFAMVTGIAALFAFPLCGVCIWAGERYMHNGAVGALLGDTLLEAIMMFFYAKALIPDLFPRRAIPATPVVNGASGQDLPV